MSTSTLRRTWTDVPDLGRVLTRTWEPSDGDGGPPVVLVHGLGLSGRYFVPLGRWLAALGHRALAPDLPGFGRSPRPAGPEVRQQIAAGAVLLVHEAELPNGGQHVGGQVEAGLEVVGVVGRERQERRPGLPQGPGGGDQVVGGQRHVLRFRPGDARVARVAQRVPVNLVASTGYYTPDVLPPFFATHGPGRLVGGPDPLVEFFVRDIEEGIAGTGVRAGMLKVVTDAPGLTEDVARVMTAAAVAHRRTGVPITTHSRPDLRNGLDQQRFLRSRGVAPERLVIGHSGDTEDLGYLRQPMDAGSTIGMDRFVMEHVLPDDRRVATVLELLRLGYADRMVLSHDAASFSRVTPPSWRAVHAPHWHFEDISRRILPALRNGGASEEQIRQMTVDNPARLLTPAT